MVEEELFQGRKYVYLWRMANIAIRIISPKQGSGTMFPGGFFLSLLVTKMTQSVNVTNQQLQNGWGIEIMSSILLTVMVWLSHSQL